jgi:hypothetical protein
VQPLAKRVQKVLDLPAAPHCVDCNGKVDSSFFFHPHVIVSVNFASVGEVMNPTDPAIFVKLMFIHELAIFMLANANTVVTYKAFGISFCLHYL